MKPHTVIAIALTLGAAIMIVQGSAAHAAEIVLLCTNGAKAAMHDLAPEFERSSGHKLAIRYDSAAILAGRIKGGEQADLVILTAAAADELTKLGKLAGSRTDLARSGIGIAVRAGATKPDIGSVDAFKRALLAAKSVAYTTTGASGVYFSSLIERLGIAPEIKAKAKLIPGGAAGELVAKGEAEIAVQQVPELMAVPGIELVGPLPARIQHVTVFSAGVAADAKQAEAARALVRFLSTPDAARVFKARGMEPG